jgi:hypothetical protein
MYVKKQVWETKLLTVDNKSCANLAIICYPIDLDEILKAYDFGDSHLAKPNPKFVSWEFALLGDLQTTAISCHVQSMARILDAGHKFLVATQVKRRLIVQQENIFQI